MKKLICLLAIFNIGSGLFAFDRSLYGSWGLVLSEEVEEVINFYGEEVRIFNQTFDSSEYEEAEDTIYIGDYEGDSVMVQYYLLSQNKLLFLMSNLDDPTESMTMILSRL
jgi:hypothetical protein